MLGSQSKKGFQNPGSEAGSMERWQRSPGSTKAFMVTVPLVVTGKSGSN